MSGAGTTPRVAICTYRIKKGKEKQFLNLLQRHWPTLRDLELAENVPSQVFRGTDESGDIFFVEILTWRDGDMPNRAHELPAVMAIWEPMGQCCEARLGRPPMEFPLVRALSIHTNDQRPEGASRS
jgi:hypothetical protein